jgi:hypothetical protein
VERDLLQGKKKTVFNNGVQRKIFGTKRQEVKEEWRKVYT